jgi:transposase InsO family protein
MDSMPVCNMVSLQNWHNRLGHLNIQATKQLLISKKIPFNDDFSDCKTCLEMKSTRVSFPTISGSRSSRVGELLHMDLAIIGEPGLNDEKYFLLIIDDYSRFSLFYALKAKSNCYNVIKFLIQQIYNKTGRFPAKIRSDNGGEFIDDRLVTLYQDHGITRQTSCAYTPMKNGVAERNIQTVTNSGNCNLKLSGFPHEYWPLAFETANDTRNISLNEAGKSPYELWHSVLPDLALYRTFGEPGYAHILTRHSKLDANASLLYFVGMSKE